MPTIKPRKRLELTLQFIQRRLPGHMPILYYVAPEANWSTDWDGHYITQEVQRQFGLRGRLIDKPRWLAGQILHYGSLWGAVQNIGMIQNTRNEVVATVFHGNRTDRTHAFAEGLDRFVEHHEVFQKVIVSNSVMEGRFQAWGLPSEKIIRIPLGVDLALFRPADAHARAAQRARLGIAEDAFCIGSFQKDGKGWEEGLEPKLFKGPDTLLEVLTRLADKRKLHVLLTAPARGYVKQGLEKAGIPYTHLVLDHFPDLAPLYAALDVYLVTSREEGGPKGVLESLAAGIPLVTTRVGMVPDVHTHGVNALVSAVDDVDDLVDDLLKLAGDERLRAKLVKNGLELIQAYDWSLIAAQYYSKVYRDLLPR